MTIDIHHLNTDSHGRNGFYPVNEFNDVRAKLEKSHGVIAPMRMIEGSASNPKVAEKVGGPLAWVFFDGCHCRECVENELAQYADRVVPGGFMLFHDCGEEYRGYPPDQPYHGMPLRPFEVTEVLEEWEPLHPEFCHVTSTPPQLRRKTGKYFGGTRVLRRREDVDAC